MCGVFAAVVDEVRKEDSLISTSADRGKGNIKADVSASL
jgi:hypothetical protein